MRKQLLSISVACMISICGCAESKDSTNNMESKKSNLQFITNNADYYENGVVFGSDVAMFLDFDTMEKAPLCAMPNCTHTTSGCLSQMVGNEPVFYNDYIYFFTSNYGKVRETPDGKEFYIESNLMKASLDSSETEVVCKFTDCAPSYKYGGYVLNENELYFVGDDLCPTGNKDIGYSWGTSGGYHFLCSINLDTGEYKNYGSIYDGDKQYDSAAYSSGGDISGVYKDTMYLEYAFIKDNNVLQSENTDHTKLYTFLSFEFDFETKTWKESKLPFSRYMNDNTYTYYDFENKYFNVIYKDKELKFPSDHEITDCSEFNGKLFLPSDGKWIELSDSSEHSMGEYEGYDVVGYHDECYILIKGGKTDKITEEELLALDKE